MSTPRSLGYPLHLIRRFFGSLRRSGPSVVDEIWAESWLSFDECALWRAMPNVDRRHSVAVARRFNERVTDRAAMAGALLHDVGKIEADLSVWGRVIATLLGARTDRFRRYLDHEAIGADLVRAAGSAPETVELVSGAGPLWEWLCECDDR